MSNKIVPINEEVYPLDTLLNDLEDIKHNIKDLVMVVVLNDGTAYISHTGLNIMYAALACKLMDKEFNNMVELNIEEEDVQQ